MRFGAIVIAAALPVAACSWFGSDDKKSEADKQPAGVAATMSEDTLKRNCADPKWRDQNLGLWYSVCRQPLRW